MNAEAQTAWLASAVDALEDIRAEEVAAISAEIRRSVTRPAQIVPAVADKVAELRKRRRMARETEEWRQRQESLPPPEVERPQEARPFTAQEIERMPKWLRDTGLRVGYLKRVGDRIVDENA